MTFEPIPGTRVNFPDYIARRPALALHACKMLGDQIQHAQNEGYEMPFEIPPMSVLMYLDMMQLIAELRPPGVMLGLRVPEGVKRWLQ